LPLIQAELQRRKWPWSGPLIHDLSQVLYLPFDHDDGSYARDRSSYDNHGTIYGATRVAGKVGSALSFDGVDDYVEVPDDPSLHITDAITVEAWVYPKSLKTDNFIIDKRKPVAGDWFLEIYVDRIGWSIYFTTFGRKDLRVGTGKITTGKWHHLVGTYDNALSSENMKAYINAELVGTWDNPGDTIDTTTNSLQLQREYRFPALIDEVRVYNRALSAAEIQRLMNMRGI